MKEYIQITVVFAVLLMVIPSIVFLNTDRDLPARDEPSSAVQTQSENSVKIYFTEQKQIREFTMQEYMVGAVMAQMPADYEPAALQAQAVLAHTYALYRMNAEKSRPTAELYGALMSDDRKLYQAFFTPEQAKEFYKDDYEKAHKKVVDAVNNVSDKLLTYEDKPVVIAFHAVSDGFTRSAKDAWGQDIPYLTSVESKPDTLLKQAVTKTEFTSSQFREKLSKSYNDIKFSDNIHSWLNITKTGEHGLVTEISVCGKKIDAQGFCEVLDLASQSFAFETSGDKFIFTCRGLGHLVGMSQYGANEMAKQGQSCDQILTHYFTGCKICEKSRSGS